MNNKKNDLTRRSDFGLLAKYWTGWTKFYFNWIQFGPTCAIRNACVTISASFSPGCENTKRVWSEWKLLFSITCSFHFEIIPAHAGNTPELQMVRECVYDLESFLIWWHDQSLMLAFEHVKCQCYRFVAAFNGIICGCACIRL